MKVLIFFVSILLGIGIGTGFGLLTNVGAGMILGMAIGGTGCWYALKQDGKPGI